MPRYRYESLGLLFESLQSYLSSLLSRNRNKLKWNFKLYYLKVSYHIVPYPYLHIWYRLLGNRRYSGIALFPGRSHSLLWSGKLAFQGHRDYHCLAVLELRNDTKFSVKIPLSAYCFMLCHEASFLHGISCPSGRGCSKRDYH